MANTGETLDQRAKQAAADAKSGAAEFADTARERAREMAEEARERAYEYGRGYKDEAANETSKIAEALRKAADDLHDGSPQERVFARLADAVADTADNMRSMDLDDMAYAANDYARRNPALFLGGAALLGFAAARFMKSSARHGEPRIGYASDGHGVGGHDHPDTMPDDYDADDRIDRPVPTSEPMTSNAPSPAAPRTTQSTAAPQPGASTGTTSGAGTTTGAPSGIEQPDSKPEIPGKPQPGETGAVKK
ncbi:hypothetical protein [Limimaricola pyoseonensis]|uniref:Uncharacterized protein n=1 Tax=Limimaricola pyoseonensis TaxID=521013 RepID=A0A1G7F536_9RHOB|nr:hypothetical protein [Limimaricola pyoseonensis]SDE70675.1 hypothetical protein SAMN04488567_2416 [Limimaricola pyoseonensis]